MQLKNYLIFICLLATMQPVLSQQTQYNGPDNGDWFLPANWTNGVPGAGNDALIGGGSTVRIDSDLVIDFTIDNFGNIVAGAALTNKGIVRNAGSFHLENNSSLSNLSDFQNFDALIIEPSGTFVNEEGANFTNTGILTSEAILTNRGAFTNNGTIDAFDGLSSLGGIVLNNQVFNTLSLTVASTTSFINNFGAILNVEGIGFPFLVNGDFQNFGAVNNSAVLNIGNSLTNNNLLRNTGSMIIQITGQLNNAAGTVENQSLFLNEGLFTNTSLFLNIAIATNSGLFDNRNKLDNQGTFTNRTGGAIQQGFGSQLINQKTFVNEGEINSFGLLQNDRDFLNEGVIANQTGSAFRNNSEFINSGQLSATDASRNEGDFFNNGLLEINSGGVFDNFGNFVNNPTGEVVNRQEINLHPAAFFENNGMLKNVVRFFIEGTLQNQVYVENQGDIFILPGGLLKNNAMLLQSAGNLRNKGELHNAGHFVSDNCSSISNHALIANNGQFDLSGILFQYGTLAGSPLNIQGGYVHQGDGPFAPAVCKDGEFGTNIDGDVKVYASELIAFANLDSCSNIVYLANGIARPVFHCEDVGVVQNVAVSLTTRLGDSLICTAHVTPVDPLAPLFDGCPENILVMTMKDSEMVFWEPPTASDNCTPVTLTTTHEPGETFPVGLTFVTYTAEDENGNINQCQFRIDIRKIPPVDKCIGDTQPPVFSNCPGNIQTTTETGLAIVVWSQPIASDACLPITITGNHEPGEAFPVGMTTVTYQASDGAGNVSTCQFSVTVILIIPCNNDVQNPVISNCPPNEVLPINPLINGAVALWTPPTASDNCGIFSFIPNHFPGSIFRAGSTEVIYTAVDLSGNIARCSFFVTVGGDPCPDDVSVPIFSNCPSNIQVITEGTSAVVNWTAPTVFDPCQVVSFVSNYQPGSMFPLGTRLVIYQASDGKGNVSQCTFTVSVLNACDVDTTPPVIKGCPSDITVKAINNLGTAIWTPPTAIDNCTLVWFFPTHYPGASFPVGVTTVLYQAMDLKGNASTCVFHVKVEKKDPPVIACKNITVQLNSQGIATISPQSVYLGCQQNCQGVTLVAVIPASFHCGNVGVNTVTLEAEDGQGNVAACSSLVKVVLSPSGILSYAILAQEEIHLHKNTVNGNAGVWQAGKEAKIHEQTIIDGFVQAPRIDLNGSSSITGSRILAPAPAPAASTFKYNTKPEPKADTKVPDNFAGVFLLEGNNFKRIEIGKNSRAKFTATGEIFIKELILKNADNNKNGGLLFSGSTELIVKRKLEIGKRTEINWTGNEKVKIYVAEEDVLIKSSARVNASIDVRFMEIKTEDAAQNNPTILMGQFIAKKVDGNKFIEWHWAPFECQSGTPEPTLAIQPIQFDFSASVQHEQVNLYWVTNADAKTETFVVERSSDGYHFEPLFEVRPKSDSERAQLYQQSDSSPNAGDNFYRIIVRSTDGEEAFSQVRRVKMPIDRHSFTLYPNPVVSHLSVYKEDFCGKPAVVRILDSQGMVLSEFTYNSLPDGPLTVDLQGFTSGLYLLRIKVEGFRDVSRRFVVTKSD